MRLARELYRRSSLSRRTCATKTGVSESVSVSIFTHPDRTHRSVFLDHRGVRWQAFSCRAVQPTRRRRPPRRNAQSGVTPPYCRSSVDSVSLNVASFARRARSLYGIAHTVELPGTPAPIHKTRVFGASDAAQIERMRSDPRRDTRTSPAFGMINVRCRNPLRHARRIHVRKSAVGDIFTLQTKSRVKRRCRCTVKHVEYVRSTACILDRGAAQRNESPMLSSWACRPDEYLATSRRIYNSSCRKSPYYCRGMHWIRQEHCLLLSPLCRRYIIVARGGMTIAGAGLDHKTHDVNSSGTPNPFIVRYRQHDADEPPHEQIGPGRKCNTFVASAAIAPSSVAEEFLARIATQTKMVINAARASSLLFQLTLRIHIVSNGMRPILTEVCSRPVRSRYSSK